MGSGGCGAVIPRENEEEPARLPDPADVALRDAALAVAVVVRDVVSAVGVGTGDLALEEFSFSCPREIEKESTGKRE